MLNLQCKKMTKKEKKRKNIYMYICVFINKICDYRDSNPGSMGSKSTKVSTIR